MLTILRETSGMQSNTIELLQKLRYDPLDIHYIYAFYGISVSLVVTEDCLPHNPGTVKLQKLAVGSDRFYINQAVVFGRAGLEYTDVRFVAK